MNSELISWICGEWEDRVCRNYVFDLENWEIWKGGRGSFFFHEIFISATINTIFIYLVYKAKCCDPCMNRRILNCKNQKINTLRRLCPHCRKLCVAKHQFSCSDSLILSGIILKLNLACSFVVVHVNLRIRVNNRIWW